MSKKRADRPTGGRRDDDDDKKQQPNKSARLDHSGASLAAESTVAAAASSASSSSALPTIVPPLSPAQRLYHDALLSVFGFFDLRDVIRAHASCRSWRDAAHKEPSRKIVLSCEPSQLAWFCASPLRHHVGEYLSGHIPCTLEHVAALRAFPSLTRVSIDVASRSLAPLTKLRGRPKYAETIAATVAQWPSRLTYLNVGLPYSCGHDEAEVIATMQVLIDCVGQLGTLTELDLRLSGLPEGSLTLQPLLQLTKLQTLHLMSYTLVAADCSVIKQLRSLTDLDLQWANVSLEALQALCSPPHQLALLQRIALSESPGLVTAAHMEALTQLPALSALDLGTMELAAMAYLPRFPHLRTLHLRMEEVAAAAFMPHLTQCTQLIALSVHFSQFTLADLTELTRTLTALTSLTFQDIRFDGLERPDSLACLHSLPQLRELTILGCSGVRLVHLTDPAFTSLPSLRSLDVSVSAASLSAARSFFALPCKLMPQLTHVDVQVVFRANF